MFRNVAECAGMFHVPGFIDALKETPVSIWNGLAVHFAYPGREFRLWSDFGTALIQTTNFSRTEPNA